MWIDTHAHLSSFEETKIQSALINAKQAHLSTVINICTDMKTLEKGLEIESQSQMVKNTAALTPHDIDSSESESFFQEIETSAEKKQLVAIGESGLDYYYENLDKKTQKKWLLRHFELALTFQLPLVIHCRDAFSDLFDYLDAHYLSKKGAMPGILHCFTGNLQEAKKVIERGFYLSFSGIVTFKNSKQLQMVAKEIPLENCVIETDAPYLSPQSKRGQINEPANVVEVGQFLSTLHEKSIDDVANITTMNAKKIFSLK